jgi:hypothetical protein
MRKKKTLPVNQFDDIKKWITYYETNNKLPHDKIICSKCKFLTISLKGRGKKIIFDSFENDIQKILTQCICKECKKEFYPEEKKKKEFIPETIEERERRIEQIRASLPKIDLNKERTVIDLTKDDKACSEYTRNMCIRPDIFLDNDRTCDMCSLRRCCSCRIKKFSKYYDEKSKK